ncbi:MAG: winged helix-turn-helix transcriptional regulator [Halobacteriota archaeon]
MNDFEFEYDAAVLVLGQHLIAGKWTIPILWHLREGDKRFSELHNLCKFTSHSVFTKQLRQLEDSGLIKRDVHSEVPVRVEYSLTEIGEKLIPVLSALIDWSQDYIECQKEEGISDIDFIKNSFLPDKYKAYQRVALILKDRKSPKDTTL